MSPLVVIGLLVGLPIIFIVLFKANAAMVFLALCAGSILAKYISTDATNIFNSFLPSAGTLSASIVTLTLLFAPPFFTAVFTGRNMSGAKSIINLGPAIAVGAAAALLAVPFLPGGVQYNIVTTSAWTTLEQYQGAIIATAVLISLLALWFVRPVNRDKRKKHK